MPESSAPEHGLPAAIRVVARAEGFARLFELSSGSRARSYRIDRPDQENYLDFLSEAARDFGLRSPSGRAALDPPPGDPALRPLLTRPVSPGILYGYGDPCVVRVLDPSTDQPAWWLTCTSNDAPEAFPILRSDDLTDWRPEGFAFPKDRTPPWALTGEGRADFWAPELHRMGEDWWLLFAARLPDRELAIGLAKGSSPSGPFTPEPNPLLGGGVIDPHLFVWGDQRLLYWKEDANGVWPRRLAALMAQDPTLARTLFDADSDRRTAAFAAAVWPWAEHAEPMEQFFILQPLIEAVTSDYASFALRLAGRARARPQQACDLETVMAALKTRILAQPLSADGRRLEGEPQVVLENDQAWEAHLIEGVWVTEHAGRFYMFYAGNDFSTPHYAIGTAVADHPLGPWRKARPLLRSSRDWVGPGHPSVAPGPDGRPWLFLHAFRPGHVGYKAFRAVLGARLAFGPDGPTLA
ncbi:MAG: family 43 glycosylhydrolase [Caulobacteraceae bacterium]